MSIVNQSLGWVAVEMALFYSGEVIDEHISDFFHMVYFSVHVFSCDFAGGPKSNDARYVVGGAS